MVISLKKKKKYFLFFTINFILLFSFFSPIVSPTFINELSAKNTVHMDGYKTLKDLEDKLRYVESVYPSISTLTSIGKTYENRNIWCMEITDNPGVEEDEPGVLFIGLTHAKEWPTLEICVKLIEKITDSYNKNHTITDLVNSRRIWIIPCLNPDGYYFSHDWSIPHEWRKNRRYFPSSETYGVDINRNFAGSSNGDALGSWGSISSSFISHIPIYETYCGPVSVSEQETMALQQLVINNEIHAAISWHTYGETVMWPWSYSPEKKTPDDQYLSIVGSEIASKISTVDQTNSYQSVQSADFYPTSGDFIDWAYGYSHYILGRPLFAYTIEACTDFHPEFSDLQQVCKENIDGALYLIEQAENISELNTRPIPPLIDVSVEKNNRIMIELYDQINQEKTEKFQLDILKSYSTTIDHADTMKEHVNTTGFSLSNNRYHSSPKSYYAQNLNQDVRSLNTEFPLFISQPINLSFWTWYDLIDGKDIVLIEISQNGRTYEILDSFSGNSNGWIKKEYSLNNYAGESIFFRLRFTSDPSSSSGEIYIDDIYPIPNYGNITLFSDEITESNITIANVTKQDYYLRIRGFNNVFQWGDYGSLTKIPLSGNQPPSTPIISGKTNGKINQKYFYEIVSTDNEDNLIYYNISWGDNSSSNWIGPFRPDMPTVVNHTWSSKGDYEIKVKAKDIYDDESDWGLLKIRMVSQQKTIDFFQPFYFFEKFISQFSL